MGDDGKARPVKFFNKAYAFDELPSELPKEGEFDVAKALAGPLREMSWEEAFKVMGKAEQHGKPHIQYADWQVQYGGAQGLGANIVVPKLLFARENGDTGNRKVPIRTQQVVIGNPEDAAMISKMHIRKQPNFNTALFGSIISTVDNDHWHNQREHLVTAFLPKASLARIFPISLERAKHCAQRFRAVSEDCSRPVDMNEFFLYETEAQLQLALFGEDNEFMERTNERFRNAMAGKEDPRYVRKFCNELSSRFRRPTNACPVHPDQAAAAPADGCPFKGPLANRIASLESDRYTEAGNSLIFAFAGHDTTGHTLTWLLFELARHPEYQAQVQHEIDAFFAAVGDREPVYEDLKNLPFLTRCIMETLRLWPAVANGTFRELERPATITGPAGEPVELPKGTYVQIVNWSRHRNPDLWGPDVDEFNPNREFQPDEVWNNEGLAAYNPATPRFSPFTFPRRGCIGMNFAQLEMRLILAYLLRDYSFDIDAAYHDLSPEEEKDLGVNYGTMGPRDRLKPPLVKYAEGFSASRRAPGGMPFTARPRGAPRPRL